MESYAQAAVAELKASGEWDGDEERINYLSEKELPKREIILIILRGESPESIAIELDLSAGKRRDHIDETKRQIKSYFKARRKTTPIVVFSIDEYKKKLRPKN
jgi:FixJ family two-component response regulator